MSSSSYQFRYLFSPYKIGNVEIKNRMVFQPHGTFLTEKDGLINEVLKKYNIERAKGGIGLIIIESMVVHETGLYAPGNICAYKEKNAELFRDMTEGIHSYGCRVFGQLSHCGCDKLEKPAPLAYSASAVSVPGSRIVPKELEINELDEIIKGFGKSALVLKQGGFDGVELKFAHDGLLHEFCSPMLNQRKDQYGGSYENRLRFLGEVVKEIRRQVGQEFPIGVRLCLDEFTEWGYSLDYGVQLAKTCEELGLDYINGDSGSFVDASMQIFPMCVPLGAGVYMASAVKKAVKIPVIGFGRLNDPVLMEMALEEKHCDFVGSARQFICDPETANKAMEGRLNDIRHCIACNDGCIYQCMQGKTIHCVQNPAAGREIQLGTGTLKMANIQKNIMVVGGGIAGMKVAEIAAMRGHSVSLYERDADLGGQINIAEKIPFRAEINEVVRYIRFQLDKYGVHIHTNKEISVEDVNSINPDVVVVATGSKPIISKWNGTESLNIIDIRQALLHPEVIGQNVVVYDKKGHIYGAGVSEFILSLGASVHYVTPFEKLGVDLDPMTLEHLNRRLFEHKNFTYYTYENLLGIKEKDVILQQIYSLKEKSIENVDTLVIADLDVADNALYKELKKGRDNVFAIGSCIAPGSIERVIYESELLGRKL